MALHPRPGTAAKQKGSGLCPQLSTATKGFLYSLIITLHFPALNSLSLLSSMCSEFMQIVLIKAKDSHYSTNLFSEHGCGLFFSKHQETAWKDKAAQPQRTKNMQRPAKVQQVEPFIHLVQVQQLHPSEFKFTFRGIPRSQLNLLGAFNKTHPTSMIILSDLTDK